MVLLPKIRQQIMVSAAQAFQMRHNLYMRIAARKFADTRAAWAEIATRPIAARRLRIERVTLKRLKFPHARILFGIACLLLLMALLLSQTASPRGTPYLTYDKVSSFQSAPIEIEKPISSGTTPCSILAVALDFCKP